MLKLAAIIWIVLGATLAGAFITVIVTVPALYADGMRLIPYAAALGFVAAIPAAFLVARRILASTGR